MKNIEEAVRVNLVKEALRKKAQAYVPYSHFHVGAAVLTETAQIIGGFNIENASYGATNCGERTAIFSALNQGAKKIRAIAIVGDAAEYTYPCGICRQVMIEFMDPDGEVIIARDPGDYKIYQLKDLLPGAFTKADLSVSQDKE